MLSSGVVWEAPAALPLPRLLPPSLRLLNPACCPAALTSPAPPAPAFIVGPRVLQLHGTPRAAADPRSGTVSGPCRDPGRPRQVTLPASAAA